MDKMGSLGARQGVHVCLLYTDILCSIEKSDGCISARPGVWNAPDSNNKHIPSATLELHVYVLRYVYTVSASCYVYYVYVYTCTC